MAHESIQPALFELIRQIDDIETDESNAYCQLKRSQVIEEERRIDEIARSISDPIVAYVQGFDVVLIDGVDGAEWNHFEWWKVRMSYMRCAPERFWKYSMRDALSTARRWPLHSNHLRGTTGLKMNHPLLHPSARSGAWR